MAVKVDMNCYLQWCEQNDIEPSREARRAYLALGKTAKRSYNVKDVTLLCVGSLNGAEILFRRATVPVRERFDKTAAMEWAAVADGLTDVRTYVASDTCDTSKIAK